MTNVMFDQCLTPNVNDKILVTSLLHQIFYTVPQPCKYTAYNALLHLQSV